MKLKRREKILEFSQNLFIYSPRLSLTRLLYPLFVFSASPSTYEATSRSARQAHVVCPAALHRRTPLGSGRAAARSSPSLPHRRKPLSSARTVVLLRRYPQPQLAFVVGTCAVASHHITSLSSARAASESDVSAVRNSRIEEKPQGVDLLD